jgi:2-iminoacetate synthase
MAPKDNILDFDHDLWADELAQVTPAQVESQLAKRAGIYSHQRLLALLSPAAEQYLEQMASQSRRLTIQRFGRTIKLYAPLYLSNYCQNSCLYCGFNTNNSFARKRLTIEEAIDEANILASQGFSDLLLVSGEDRNFINIEYLSKLSKKLKPKFSSISAEIYQLTEAQYKTLFAAGIEGVTIYQETYDPGIYASFHPAGPKADYADRLDAPRRIASAGMRQIGLGALLGLADWRTEAIALGRHGQYLMKNFWQSQVSFSFPRLRPAQNVKESSYHIPTDKNLVQMILALRLCFADAPLVLSTRESAKLRDNLINIGITKLSAGSKTNPGGYSSDDSLKQFEVDDSRSPAKIAQMIRAKGAEPVWKDWDAAFAQKD